LPGARRPSDPRCGSTSAGAPWNSRETGPQLPGPGAFLRDRRRPWLKPLFARYFPASGECGPVSRRRVHFHTEQGVSREISASLLLPAGFRYHSAFSFDSGFSNAYLFRFFLQAPVDTDPGADNAGFAAECFRLSQRQGFHGRNQCRGPLRASHQVPQWQ